MQVGSADKNRRERILSSALECFNESGVPATSIGAICSRSGASVGSVYHFFGSKDGIAAALYAEGLNSNLDHLERALETVTGAEQGIRAIVESLVQWIAAHRDWARFIYVASLGWCADDDTTAAVNARYAAVIGTYFKPYLEAAELRELPRECWSSLVVGPVHDYARRWLSGQVPVDITHHADVFASAAWNAVRRL